MFYLIIFINKLCLNLHVKLETILQFYFLFYRTFILYTTLFNNLFLYFINSI